LTSQSAIEHQNLPYDPANRQLFGVPVVTSNAQAASVGHVVAQGAVALDTDTRGVDVQSPLSLISRRAGTSLSKRPVRLVGSKLG
jgi:hypothetical protein